ncbi:uncharacterized protein B0P05DRAFT_557947 [Gilbertella persicaria]|uniref:uncharacterized protein n=1 Tax=Gilbertella persicaria TaxID=101096 RepID=UPI00221FADD9|nr:uncharacterized protein B0P05DRAFT_557947 [Gilbertella persicaria]KAI8060387.1 hypothetical protein B0P05DRAFT_557947 [Gilbertella persicaria]
MTMESIHPHHTKPQKGIMEMEQLITMMQNHKVSEDTALFDFKAPTTRIIPNHNNTSRFMPFSEFKFSFEANITHTNGTRSYSSSSSDSSDSQHIQNDMEFMDTKPQHLINRKILPLPKIRWKTQSTENIKPVSLDTNLFRLPTSADTSTHREKAKKMKCSDNSSHKRKERNWKDHLIKKDISLLELPIHHKKKTDPIVLPNKNTAKKTNQKKTKKKKKKEEMAPGGFLSSDITLFHSSSLEDEWICLFCQYDILMNGLEEARRKNGYYRRKRERNRRLKEAELKRLGLEDSEEEEVVVVEGESCSHHH